jgi:protein-disulfide isomerase
MTVRVGPAAGRIVYNNTSMVSKLFPPAIAILCCAAIGLAEAPKKSALDKPTLETYVRHLYAVDSEVTVTVSDPKPAPIAGFVQETVRLAEGNQSQDVVLYISKDGSQILQGTVYDVSHNPFKSEFDKLKVAGAPSFGTAGAPVMIVEFSDFECPYCKEEAKMLRDHLLADYPKQVKLYFREFPIESLHPWAKPAAIAGRCVFNQSAPAFWTYHDWIFGSQEQTTADNFKTRLMDWAKGQKDIDAMQLGRCMDSKAPEAEVEKSLAEAREVGVGGTPTLFINGRRIGQAIDWNTLKKIIDNEIEYQKIAKDAGDDCGCTLDLNLVGKPSGGTVLGSPIKK